MKIIYILTFILVCFSLKFIECVPNNWFELINYYESILNAKYFNEIIDSTNITKECVSSISGSLIALNNSVYWSFKMYNSWGKFPPTGIMGGTITDFGDYDQCLSIEPNQMIGESQYCLIDISIPLPNPMPIHHNMFHKVDVLLQSINKSSNNVFDKFSEEASIFYWVNPKIGICAPKKCALNDIKAISEKGKLFKTNKCYYYNDFFKIQL
jgi:hypothetical protein